MSSIPICLNTNKPCPNPEITCGECHVNKPGNH